MQEILKYYSLNLQDKVVQEQLQNAGHFGPPVLHVSISFEERSVTQ